MALLYPRSKVLQSHLSEYFVVVVSLCHRLLKFSRKSVLGQVTSALSDVDLKSFQTELEYWANSIRDEVHILMARKIEEESHANSRFRSLSERFSKSMSHQQILSTRLRILDFCSKYDYVTAWKQIRKLGNATIYRTANEYQEWKGRSSSSTLVYRGKLGSGKSVLLANIVDDLHILQKEKKNPVAYFFCRHDISESLEAKTIIGSLVRQLLRALPDLSMISDVYNVENLDLQHRTTAGLLHQAIPPDFKAYIILDGLDECNPDELKTVIEEIQKLQAAFALLLCISMREQPRNTLDDNLEHLADTHITDIPEDNVDIESFIDAELKDRLETCQLVIGDPTLILEIQDTLFKGSRGMFLWVALQIQAICAMKSDRDIRDALADLPRDLPETFVRILKRSDTAGKSYQGCILRLVVAAYRPLTTEELREALSVRPRDTVWDPARLLNEVYSALASCGSLLTVDEEEQTVRLIHHSVQQFLLGDFGDKSELNFTLDKAHGTMADIVVTYLNYGTFGTELTKSKIPKMAVGSTPTEIMRSATKFSHSAQILALGLLKSRKRAEVDISKSLAGTRRPFHSTSMSTFRLYSYAVENCVRHLTELPELTPVVLDLLERVLEGKVIKLRSSDRYGQELLLQASKHGHAGLVKLLLDNGTDVDVTIEPNGDSPLFHAARGGHAAVVDLLIENGAKLMPPSRRPDPDSKVFSHTPLSLAAEEGHLEVVRRLLVFITPQTSDIDSFDILGSTPLARAANAGHTEIVRLLLATNNFNGELQSIFRTGSLLHDAIANGLIKRNGQAVTKMILDKSAAIGLKDTESGQTIFSWTLIGGFDAALQILVDTGVDINSFSAFPEIDGLAPLHYAAERGHDKVVRILLRAGANIDAMDATYQTPLILAAKGGKREVVRALLGNGASMAHVNGMTPLHVAVNAGYAVIVDIMLNAGADVDTVTEKGETPLMLAVNHGYRTMLGMLIGKGANVHLRDDAGVTALQRAISNKQDDIAMQLRRALSKERS